MSLDDHYEYGHGCPECGRVREGHESGCSMARDPGLEDDGAERSKCCNARMVNGGVQCETCGSNGL